MTMKPHLDYATNYDVGTDSVQAIQPFQTNEVVTPGVMRRPSENLRRRSETLRAAVDQLLYFRDRPAYLLECASSGKLAWGGTVAEGGDGVLNNTTNLLVKPLGGSDTNIKGVIGIGTAGTNRVNYTVQAGAYATMGVNRWSVEQRAVASQPAIQVNIGDGPNYFILVTFDDTNNSHDAPAICTAVNAAIGASALAGMLTAVPDAISSNAGLDSGGAVTFYDGVVSATISGTPTVDVEEHLIPAGALGVLTTSTPLVEGSTILIAYRDLIEPNGGDALDPKGVLAGGRAESNPARGNTDVTGNLVILAGDDTDGLHLPGAIPLVKISGGVARFVDGTSVAAGATLAPGSALGVEFDASTFQGPTSLVTGGGILSTDITLDQALQTVDDRLGQRRTVTWTVTDGSASTGGDFDAAAGIVSAIGASPGGGEIYVRRGAYTGLTVNTNVGDLLLRSEYQGCATLAWATGVSVSGVLRAKSMEMIRTGVITALLAEAVFEDTKFRSGAFLFGPAGAATLTRCTMVQTSQSSGDTAGLYLYSNDVTVDGGSYAGPDVLVTGGNLLYMENTRVAKFSNVRFTVGGTASILLLGALSVGATIEFDNCRFENSADAYLLNLAAGGGTRAKLTFSTCTFVNNTAARLLRIASVSADVTFNRCHFYANNSATPTASIVVVAPSAGQTVTFNGCVLHISKTAAGSVSSFSLVELGGAAETPAAGRVVTRGLTIEYAGSIGLHAARNIRLYQNSGTNTSGNLFDGVTVECNGNVSQAASGGSGVTPYALVHATGTDLSRRLDIRNLSISGINYPTGAGDLGIVYTLATKISGLNVEPVASPSAGKFGVCGYLIFDEGSRVTNADFPIMCADMASVAVAVFSGTVSEQSELLDSRIWGAAGGGGGGVYSLALRLSAMTRVSMKGLPNPTLIASNTGGNTFHDCEFDFTASAQPTIIDCTATPSTRITNCKFVFNHGTPNVLDGAAGVANTGCVITGNQFLNLNAAVYSVPSAPSGSTYANNPSIGSVTVY